MPGVVAGVAAVREDGVQMTAPIVQIQDVSLRFGAFTALDGVSLDVHLGQCTVICGPSGSGKSTLLRCVNGLEQFQSGDVLVDGVSVRDCRDLPKLRRGIGMVFQHFELYPHLTVLQNLTLAPVRAKGLTRAMAERIAMDYLERVGIADQAHKHPGLLSGGQQQRAAIARALVLEPKLMMFDEPTSALDPEMIFEVLQVVLDLARDGMTMLVVTHEMGFAREMADEIVFMDHGKVVEKAAPSVFFSAPRTSRASEFLRRILRHV
jgi:ABC-type polar amino acid transport system ATPase subunit